MRIIAGVITGTKTDAAPTGEDRGRNALGFVLVALWAVLAATALSFSADARAADAPAADAPEADEMQAVAEALEKAGSPGEHHAHLAKMEGEWETLMQMWMSPDGDPVETPGTATNEVILDGRFVRMTYSSSFMGQPFTGIGLEGYDNLRGKHVGSWIDSASTMLMTFTGDCSDSGKVMQTESEFLDPMTGEMSRMKSKTTVHGDDHYVFESWNLAPDGEFYKSMQIDYRRKKS